MSKQCTRSRHALLEKRTNTSPSRDRQNPNNNNSFNFLKKIYPIGLHKTCSPLSLSSLSLSLSQTSNDSSITDSSVTPLDQKIAFALRLIAPPERREALTNRSTARQQPSPSPTPSPASSLPSDDNEEVKRCNWITENSAIHRISDDLKQNLDSITGLQNVPGIDFQSKESSNHCNFLQGKFWSAFDYDDQKPW